MPVLPSGPARARIGEPRPGSGAAAAIDLLVGGGYSERPAILRAEVHRAHYKKGPCRAKEGGSTKRGEIVSVRIPPASGSHRAAASTAPGRAGAAGPGP